MGILDDIFGKKSSDDFGRHDAIKGGKQKKDGSHDHRTNTGKDRTPSQKEGDEKRKKD